MIRRLRCVLRWISRGPHGLGAVWTDDVLDPRIVALLIEEWDRRCIQATGDRLDADLEVVIDRFVPPGRPSP